MRLTGTSDDAPDATGRQGGPGGAHYAASSFSISLAIASGLVIGA